MFVYLCTSKRAKQKRKNERKRKVGRYAVCDANAVLDRHSVGRHCADR